MRPAEISCVLSPPGLFVPSAGGMCERSSS
jgi:hypothetical protein